LGQGESNEFHSKNLLEVVAESSGVNVDQIVDVEISFIDSQPASIIGISKDVLSSS
jgi:aspartyl aminopeptidase